MTEPTPAPQRGPLDEITRPLWRLSRADRRDILEPFLDRRIHIERWPARLSSADNVSTYSGTLVAIAVTTIGTASDLAILRTTDGTTWAISTAQIAYLRLEK